MPILYFINTATTIFSALVLIAIQIRVHSCIKTNDGQEGNGFLYVTIGLDFLVSLIVLGLVFFVKSRIFSSICIFCSPFALFYLWAITMRHLSLEQGLLYFCVSTLAFFAEVTLLLGSLYLGFEQTSPFIETELDPELIFLYNCFAEGFKNYAFPPEVFGLNLPCIQSISAAFMIPIIIGVLIQLLSALIHPTAEEESPTQQNSQDRDWFSSDDE